jgi:hypothetical protein
MTLSKGGVLGDYTNMARFALWSKKAPSLKSKKKKNRIE